MNFSVIASFSIETGSTAAFEAALKILTDATRRESGCIQYEIHTNTEVEGGYFIIEKYESEQDYLFHREQQHILDFRQIATPLFKEKPLILRGQLAW